MKIKKWMIILVVLLVLVGLLYAYLNYTMRGRVLAMYTFAGFGAPVTIKTDCAKETDYRVEEKFKLPLDFDERSKNALREFWHFSYYRECLFKAGYDFYGNEIQPSAITSADNGGTYNNYFAGVEFAVPDGAKISYDNLTDPDVEDRRLSSAITLGEEEIRVMTYRSFERAESFDDLVSVFERFATSTGNIIESREVVNESDNKLLVVEQDDGLTGVVTISDEGRVVQIFSQRGKDMLANVISSINFKEPAE